VPFVRPVIVAVVSGGLPVTTVGVCAVEPMYGVTVYFVIALPPSDGAVQLTAACPLPGDAATEPGTPGTLGAAVPVALRTSVAASHGVFAPVLVAGLAVVPASVSTRSWTSSSMSFVGETFVRTV
jgi:hypothetical protein